MYYFYGKLINSTILEKTLSKKPTLRYKDLERRVKINATP